MDGHLLMVLAATIAVCFIVVTTLLAYLVRHVLKAHADALRHALAINDAERAFMHQENERKIAELAVVDARAERTQNRHWPKPAPEADITVNTGGGIS